MNKRDFLKKASLVTVLASFGLSLDSCSEDEIPDPTGGSIIEVDLTESPFTALQDDMGWVLHPDYNILMVNVAGNISAFSSQCTHSGCTRSWGFSTEFTCTCHGSKFDTNGDATKGPASQSLAKVPVSQSGTILKLG